MKIKIRDVEIQIDEQDLPLLEEYNWFVVTISRKGTKRPYVKAKFWIDGKEHRVALSDLILPPVPKTRMKFLDGDSLNLQRANLVRSPFSENLKTELHPCPFSNERLYELRWKEQKYLDDVARMAQEIMAWKIKPDIGTVSKWYKNAGYTISDREERKRLALLLRKQQRGFLSPESIAKSTAWRRHHARPYVIAGQVISHKPLQMHTKGARRKMYAGIQKRAEKYRQAHLVTRYCAICGTEVKRYAHRFTGENAFCCRSHQAKFRHREYPIFCFSAPEALHQWLTEIGRKRVMEILQNVKNSVP